MPIIKLTPTSACAWPDDYGPPDDAKLAHWVLAYIRSFQPGRARYDATAARLPLVTKAVVVENGIVLASWSGADKPRLYPR